MSEVHSLSLVLNDVIIHIFVALQLVKIRAEAMQLASEAYKGGMATVIYGPDSNIKLACTKAKQWAIDRGDLLPECIIANYLYPHCKVIAGSESVIFFYITLKFDHYLK